MSTISPTLTQLKGEELIVRDGLKVALTKRVPPWIVDKLRDNAEAERDSSSNLPPNNNPQTPPREN